MVGGFITETLLYLHIILVFSASRSHSSCLGEFAAGAADWPRGLQAERHLCVCTHGQRKDPGICHTCDPGEVM